MSGTDVVVVIARWQITAAALSEVLGYVTELREQSLAEPGCVGYEVFQSRDDATALLLVERYRDSAAVDAHRESAHYRELVTGRIAPLLIDRKVELFSEAFDGGWG